MLVQTPHEILNMSNAQSSFTIKHNGHTAAFRTLPRRSAVAAASGRGRAASRRWFAGATRYPARRASCGACSPRSSSLAAAPTPCPPGRPPASSRRPSARSPARAPPGPSGSRAPLLRDRARYEGLGRLHHEQRQPRRAPKVELRVRVGLRWGWSFRHHPPRKYCPDSHRQVVKLILQLCTGFTFISTLH